MAPHRRASGRRQWPVDARGKNGREKRKQLMPTKYDDALAALEAERGSVEARLNQLNVAIDALRGIAQTAPAARRPGRPRKAAAAPAPAVRAAKPAKKPAGRRGRKPRGAKKPAAPKLEPRIEEYFASDPFRRSTAQEISAALRVDQRAVRLSLGRMAKKNKATRLDDGSYTAYAG